MFFLEDSIYNPPQPVASARDAALATRGSEGSCRRVVPFATLLEAYQDGEFDFREFSHRYTAEVQTNAGVLDHLRQLERVHGDVALRWERPPRQAGGRRCSRGAQSNNARKKRWIPS